MPIKVGRLKANIYQFFNITMKNTVRIFLISSKFSFLLLSSFLFCFIVLMIYGVKHSLRNLQDDLFYILTSLISLYHLPRFANVLIWQEESFCTVLGPPQSALNLWCPLHQRIQYQKRPQRSLPLAVVSVAEGISADKLEPNRHPWKKDDFSTPPPPDPHSPTFCQHLSVMMIKLIREHQLKAKFDLHSLYVYLEKWF